MSSITQSKKVCLSYCWCSRSGCLDRSFRASALQNAEELLSQPQIVTLSFPYLSACQLSSSEPVSLACELPGLQASYATPDLSTDQLSGPALEIGQLPTICKNSDAQTKFTLLSHVRNYSVGQADMPLDSLLQTGTLQLYYP